MLVTILDYLYILLTCGIVGSFIIHRVHDNGVNIGRSVSVSGTGMNPGSCIVCGIAVLTAYAGYFSLFAGVGIAANVILIISCLIFVFIDRKSYLDGFSQLYICVHGRKDNDSVHHKGYGRTLRTARIIKYLLALMIIFVCAYFTSSGRFAYDTGTYHAQSIHWIESYGVVKGLAYMQTRLGFNSSYFCLCALYSMHFMGQSLHSLSGFFAAFVMIYSLNGWFVHIMADNMESGLNACKHELKLRVSDLMYLAPFVYFAVTAVEVISPTTDFGVIWLMIWLCIRWVELTEEANETGHNDTGTGQALLCVMAVFLISVKLSAGILALLVIKPAYELIRDRKWTDIVRYLAAGIILILPYFIRDYFITGWLIYPFPAIDLFDPDWKIPLEGVKYEADEIVVWARYTKDTALIDQGIREWFPVWWEEQGEANRHLSVSAFTGAGLIIIRTAVSMVYSLYLRAAAKKGRLIATPVGLHEHGSYIYFGLILFVSFTFFMLSAPSNRFGYAYIIILPLFAAGDMIVNVLPTLRRKKDSALPDRNGVSVTKSIIDPFNVIFAAIIFLIACNGMLRGAYMYASDDRHYISETGLKEYAVYQKDYPEADSSSREWEGMRIYFPVVEGEQIWYHDFPAILYEGNLAGIERRGETIRDGFRLK